MSEYRPKIVIAPGTVAIPHWFERTVKVRWASLVDPRNSSIRAEVRPPLVVRFVRGVVRLIAAMVKLLIGAGLCFHYASSVLVVGWTFRPPRSNGKAAP